MSVRSTFCRLASLGALTAVMATLFAPIAAGSATAVRHYVALGDSYTSGPLIPVQRLLPLGCGRSTNNYPTLLAGKIKPAKFTDVSCGGADTSHMTAPQSVPLGRNAPQFSALTPQTDLVTVSIGGNDFSLFSTAITTCTALRPTDPKGAPCARHFGNSLAPKISQIGARVVQVLKGIRERSPHAKIVVIGYPRILPPSGTCSALPFAAGDYSFLDSTEQALNRALQQAASITQNSFVDTYQPSLNHHACAPRGTAWINGQHTDLFAAAAYHPFRVGMVGVANVIYGALTSSQVAR